MHVIAAKAVALKVAATEEFKARQERTLSGAKILAERLTGSDVAGAGVSVLTGGTDVHLVLVDLRDSPLDGQQAEDLLHEVGITVNRNAVPFDPRPPMVTSGLRIGTPRWPPVDSATSSSPRSPTSSRPRWPRGRRPTSRRCVLAYRRSRWTSRSTTASSSGDSRAGSETGYPIGLWSILDTDELVIALEKALPELSEEHQLDIARGSPTIGCRDAGRNFAFLGGEDWDPSDSTMSDEAKAALMALLLLKDNLPSYHRVLAMFFPAFSDWRALVGTWTAEDNRHAIVLRDYLVVTRAVDPVDAENRRRIHVVAGYRQHEEDVASLTPMSVLALLAVHELQTAAFAERMRGAVTDDVLAQILTKIHADDASQARYFIGFLGAGMVADQDATVSAIDGR